MQQSRREAIQRGADGVPTVPNLGVALESARVSAAVNSLLGSDNQRSPSAIKLPFASVSKFDLTLHCRGGPVGIDDATISCEPFSGSERATSDHVVDHYAAIVRRRAPYLLIAKTNVAGVNVADSASMIAGKVVTSTSVIGATVGVVSRDMVGSALTQGKESRGASATDKYQFGDFSRGVVSSLSSSSVTGAASTAGSYASENRVRLAGATGSAAGMVAGAALLGPVGLVAGSVLGGSAARSTTKAVSGDPTESGGAGAQGGRNSRSNESAAAGGNDRQGYKFGDLTRGVLSRGKKADGRSEKDGYKFGDFTRGLWS